MKKILFILSIFFTVLGFSQTRDTSYIKVYSGSGYDYSRDVIQLADSNFVITGSSSSFPSANADVLLMKVGHYGDVIWSEAYGGAGDDWGTQVSELPDSSLIVSGYTNSFGQGGFDFYLFKTDSAGNLKWSKTFGGPDWDFSHAHIIAEDKDIILVGETQSFGNGNKDIMLVRTDSMGNEKWRKYYGGAEDDIAYDIAHDPNDSTLYLAGVTESFGNQEQGYLLKLDYDGDTIFTKVVGGDFDDGFMATKINSLNNLVVTGYKGENDSDLDFWFYTLELSSNLAIVDTTDGGNDIEIVYDFDIGSFDEILFGGSTTSFGNAINDGLPDLWLGNRQSNGVWLSYFNNFGEQGVDDIRSVKWLQQEGIVAVGNTEFYSDSENGIILIRIDLSKNAPQYTSSQNEDINSTIVDFSHQSNNIKISPNPIKNELSLEMPKSNSNSYARIFSTDGKEIESIELDKLHHKINTSEWEKGMYFITIFERGASRRTFKVVK